MDNLISEEQMKTLGYIKFVEEFNEMFYRRGEIMTEQQDCLPLGQESKCVREECGHWSKEKKRCIYYDLMAKAIRKFRETQE